nr:PREDICTED: uncharacterized protein LOC107077478 isoform X1 [Lepisosteus oculatus]XP_015203835.1 PREDICTED: uncharacterized protein LOC107077478 isoform X1 [Lepisosteus oculatus]
MGPRCQGDRCPAPPQTRVSSDSLSLVPVPCAAGRHLRRLLRRGRAEEPDMRLPGVSLPSTPVSAGMARAAAPARRRYLVTPLALPAVSPAAVPLSVSQCPTRINPLHPPSGRRRTVSLETLAAHHHNQQRVLVMQQKEYFRFHQAWQRPFYGCRADKEEYRQEVRELLQRQMLEKWERQRQLLASQTRELEALREADRLALTRETQENQNRARALSHYRDENKRMMEQGWRERALSRSLEVLRDRELLQYNPINWSGTLK